MTSSRMFHTLLGAGNVPPLLQEQAYRFAVRTSDAELLQRLACLPELTKELDTMLGQRDELWVLSSWARRPERTREEIIKRFSAEKRATLLQDLASSSGLPDEVYEQLAKNKAVSIGWALLANEDAPRAIRLSKAKQMAEGLKASNNSLYRILEPVLAADDELYGIFVSSTPNARAIWVLAGQLPENASDERIIVTLDAAATQIEKGVVDWALSRAITDVLGRSTLSDAVATHLFENTEKRVQDAAAANRDIQWSVSGITDEFDRLRKRQATDFSKYLSDIQEAPNPAAIRAAVTSYRALIRDLRMMWDFEEMGTRVLRNPHADPDLVNEYSTLLTEELALQIGERALANKDLALASTLFRCASYRGYDAFAYFYKRAEDPEQFLSWLLGDSTEAPQYMTTSSVITGDADLVLRLMPAATTLASTRFAGAVSAYLTEQLGDSPALWDTMTTLADEWTGSFTGLVTAAKNLAT